MAWQNHAWAWSVRGVIPSERLILLALVNAAGENGFVEMYSIAGLRNKVPELKRRAMQKILRGLLDKGFIQERIRRSILGKGTQKHTVLDHHKGLQISNAYQLDLKRLFPRDPANPGPRLWKEVIAQLHKAPAIPESEGAIDELMRPEYPAYFEIDETTERHKVSKRMSKYGLLCVHCESARAEKFCRLNIKALVAIGETLTPPVHNFRFTYPRF